MLCGVVLKEKEIRRNDIKREEIEERMGEEHRVAYGWGYARRDKKDILAVQRRGDSY